MKKIITFIICFLLVSSPNAHSFLGEDLGLDLYKSIDNGFEELELKNYSYELQGYQGSIQENINDLLESNAKDNPDFRCITQEITVKEFNEIYFGNIALLSEKIDQTCKTDNGDIDIQRLNSILSSIQTLGRVSQENAEQKTKEIHRLSRIGLYSDGIIENSSFDLIEDLKKIDDVIFTNEIEYLGEEYEDLDSYIDQFTGGNSEDPTLGNLQVIDLNKLKQQRDLLLGVKSSPKYFQIGTITNQYICSSDESGLSADILNSLIEEIESGNAQLTDSQKNIIKNISPLENQNNITNAGPYEKVNDNNFWPCSNFFCIVVDLKMYNQALLGGGNDISIEGIIARANEHLRKFSSTSLVGATMTINNFELAFKNLKLADMFHLGIQVVSKPIPILDVIPEGDDNEDKTEFSGENMIEKYYQANKLEYKRRNDLTVFTHLEREKKSVGDSGSLPITTAEDKFNNFIENLNEQKGMENHIENAIQHKVISGEMDDFNKQFIELERFTAAIYDYVSSMRGIVKKMDEIPSS